jgi:ribosome-associated heat shock protein Hsp15
LEKGILQGIFLMAEKITMNVRLDKWLQIARIFKTRSKATVACNQGKVQVNGFTVKPHRNPAVDDRIEIKLGDWTRIIIVKELREKSVTKAVAATLFEDLSPPRPKLDRIDRIMMQGTEYRERGKGRPTKRERREIDRLRDG